MAFVTWGGNYCIAQEVTLDFTQNGWKLPDSATDTDKSFTYNNITISTKGGYFNTNTGCLMIKGKGATSTLTLPAFDFAVEKIEVVGKSAASKNTKENIYVGNIAVSTEETGSKGTNTFVINKQYQAAGTIYTLQVSAANAQITYIKIYKRAVDLTATTLTLSAVPTEPIAIGGTFSSTPTLKAGEQTLSGKTITWSSDNKDVATVDANGTVTGVGLGNANITATFAGDEVYEASKASYGIKVKDAPALSFSQTSYMIEMGDAFSEPTLQGLPTGVTAKYFSSNADVATVDESTGKVQIVGVGTTTIKAVSEAKDVYEAAEASYELTVKSATTKKVIFDFANQVDVSNIEEGGVCLKFEKGGEQYEPIWNKDGHIRFYNQNVMTITANSNIKNVVFEYTASKYNIKSAQASPGNYEANVWDFSGIKKMTGTLINSGTVARIKRIIVTTELPTSAGAINIATEEGFGTFYTDKNYVLPQGLTAFGYTSIDGNTLTKSVEYVAGDIVPANTAVVVKGAKGSYNYYNTEEAATKTIERNLLKGVTTDTRFEATSGVKRYILTRADDGILAFYRTNTGNINVKANRAYLEVPTAMAVASFSLEGSATGINNVVTTAAKQGIYTISGVRLNATTTKELPAGIYIVDGKKVIVK